MTKNRLLTSLTEEEITLLNTSLYFLHVNELKDICHNLLIPHKGTKLKLIIRIIHFIKTNEIVNEPITPIISCIKKGIINQLSPDSLILKGQYKNDLKTRLFFKSLIGEHFHFTAFGIDWINERWLAGLPPTYQEYAIMWHTEYQRRIDFGSHAKEEWAYINFVQKLINEESSISHSQIIKRWETERSKHKQIVEQIMNSLLR